MTIYERGRWLDSKTPVTDDPRRLPVPPRAESSEPPLVLLGGRVFDGVDGEVRSGTIVLRGNRIERVLWEEDPDLPADARIIDARGKTVIPGLIDLHTHLTYQEPGEMVRETLSLADATLRGVEKMKFYLASGITSVRDAGSQMEVPFRLKAWATANRVPGPRIFPAGCLITGTGGHGAEDLSRVSAAYGTMREASGPDDWREAVREMFKAGADVIKVASHFSREEIAAAVDEAHTLGLRVMCDAETHYIDWAVEAGVDCIEHPLPRTNEAIQEMAKRGVASVPTLIPYIIIFDQYGGYFHSTSRRFTFSKEDNLELVRNMHDAGVKIGVGTDLVSDWFRLLPDAYIRELKELTRAGMTEPEALLAATRSSAEILDMIDRLGTLEPGKLADVLVIDGRPDENLDDLGRPEMVIRDGQIMVRDGSLVVPAPEAISMAELK